MLSLLLALFPSFIQVPIRRLQGARIGSGSIIRFGTILTAREIEIGENVRIGPFAVVRARKLRIGSFSRIKSLSMISTHTIDFGRYVHIAPTAVIHGSMLRSSKLKVGDHSRIFPFCWLEPGEGIEIGRQVGIGGHGLIFTHGAWPDYINGGLFGSGPVFIEDNVWIPWRVMILPNVRIGRDSVIAAGSVVNRSIPEHSLAGGAPAKVVKQGIQELPDDDERLVRAKTVLDAYLAHSALAGTDGHWQDNTLIIGCRIGLGDASNLGAGDLYFSVAPSLSEELKTSLIQRGISVFDHYQKQVILSGDSDEIQDFIGFARGFGIRPDIERAAGGSQETRGSPAFSNL